MVPSHPLATFTRLLPQGCPVHHALAHDRHAGDQDVDYGIYPTQVGQPMRMSAYACMSQRVVRELCAPRCMTEELQGNICRSHWHCSDPGLSKQDTTLTVGRHFETFDSSA